MKKTIRISAIIDQPDFLEDMVEKLALRHTDHSNNKQKTIRGSKAFETSSNETYVSGTLAIDDPNQHISMPFITSFLFTCIKVTDDTYSLEWGISMS